MMNWSIYIAQKREKKRIKGALQGDSEKDVSLVDF